MVKKSQSKNVVVNTCDNNLSIIKTIFKKSETKCVHKTKKNWNVYIFVEVLMSNNDGKYKKYIIFY